MSPLNIHTTAVLYACCSRVAGDHQPEIKARHQRLVDYYPNTTKLQLGYNPENPAEQAKNTDLGGNFPPKKDNLYFLVEIEFVPLQ